MARARRVNVGLMPRVMWDTEADVICIGLRTAMHSRRDMRGKVLHRRWERERRSSGLPRFFAALSSTFAVLMADCDDG
jgi:hypothetical protein